MKKAFLMIIASALLGAEPLIAASTQATDLPGQVSDEGLNLNTPESTDQNAENDSETEEMEPSQGYFPRYCPRGYVRRCFCMRLYWPRRPSENYNDNSRLQQSPMTPANSQELGDNNEALDESTGEMDTMQGYYPRYCPRGYVRRCRCVRRPYWPRRPPYREFENRQAPMTPMEKSDNSSLLD